MKKLLAFLLLVPLWAEAQQVGFSLGTTDLTAAGPIGSVTPGTGAFTTLSNTGAATNSAAGAVSAPALKITGVPSSAGTTTTDFPLLYINDANATASTTLNTAGTYLGVNGDGSQDLMNLLKDGESKFKVSSAGTLTVAGNLTFTGASTITWPSVGGIASDTNGVLKLYTNSFATSVGLRSTTTGLLEVRISDNSAPGRVSALGVIATGSTWATLPTATAGTMAYVTDGLAAQCGDGTCTTFGTTVLAGGGAMKLLVWYNGTNWTLMGK